MVAFNEIPERELRGTTNHIFNRVHGGYTVAFTEIPERELRETSSPHIVLALLRYKLHSPKSQKGN
jgi:hypothetical protein